MWICHSLGDPVCRLANNLLNGRPLLLSHVCLQLLQAVAVRILTVAFDAYALFKHPLVDLYATWFSCLAQMQATRLDQML